MNKNAWLGSWLKSARFAQVDNQRWLAG